MKLIKLIILVCFCILFSFINIFSFFGIVPNLLFVLTVIYASYAFNSKAAIIFSWVMGIIATSVYSLPFVLAVALFSIASFTIYFIQKHNFVSILINVAIFSLVGETVLSIIERTSVSEIVDSFLSVVLPSVAVNMFCAVIICFIYRLVVVPVKHRDVFHNVKVR